MKYLGKPVAVLFVVGLVGCTATKHTPLDHSAADTSASAFNRIRVNLVTGNSYELTDAVISADGVSGTMRSGGSAFSVRHADIQPIEIGAEAVRAGRTTGLVVVLAGLTAISVVGTGNRIDAINNEKRRGHPNRTARLTTASRPPGL